MIIGLILASGTLMSDPLGAANATRDSSPLSPQGSTGKDPFLSHEEINRALSFALHLAQEHEKVVDSVKISEEIGRYVMHHRYGADCQIAMSVYIYIVCYKRTHFEGGSC
jgi:hypothetical protein